MIGFLWVPLLLPAAVIVVTILLSRLERFATRTRTANHSDAPALTAKVKGVRDQGCLAVKSLLGRPRQAVGALAGRLPGSAPSADVVALEALCRQFVASDVTSADHVGSGLRDTPVGGGSDLAGGGRAG
ncbi:hypothetical protein [Actinomycetospora cinnamomea]|uniref:hypothetical protein n=1 Tax=Actinomycetospora cinnamomea TaxID=663609 RepID=UPI001A9C4091|nr:hypothetical protein [Actinomycetospora cinnamomea]